MLLVVLLVQVVLVSHHRSQAVQCFVLVAAAVGTMPRVVVQVETVVVVVVE